MIQTTEHKQRKAVSLISGGLDSMLATKAMLDQSIHVEGLNFYTGFCHSGHTSAIRNNRKAKPKRNDALWVAEQLGIKLHIIDIVDDYKDIVINPQYGYGKNLNPCLDCKVFMVKQAKDWMLENDFDFIITGEVIGQRPKSQRKIFMPIVAKKSGADDRLLRPLCAKNLEPTLPEREGWVDRDKLFDFSGRSRKPQFAMAKEHGIEDFAQPAGGCCVLTDANYTKKLYDLWEARGNRNYELDDIILLKIGRHIRPQEHYKLIIGREEGENNFLEGYRYAYTNMRSISHNSPLALIDGEVTAEEIAYCARIVARFTDGKHADNVTMQITSPSTGEWQLNVKPLAETDVKKEWYV